MVVPVDAEVDEAQHVAQKDREHRTQRGERRVVRHVQLEHHDRDEDGDHAIAERFEPIRCHAGRNAGYDEYRGYRPARSMASLSTRIYSSAHVSHASIM